MPKRLHQSDGPPYSVNRHPAWSIGSNSLTVAGQNELLKRIGRQLQANYQDVLEEPAPDHIRELLDRLEDSSRHLDDHRRDDDL